MLKFNVDGAARGKPGSAGCGRVLWDSKDMVIGIFLRPLGVLDSNVAELNAIKCALKIFVDSS
ncbi:hypothetical protein REPUB_Repub01dG0210000 [Reevesia pubescens]